MNDVKEILIPLTEVKEILRLAQDYVKRKLPKEQIALAYSLIRESTVNAETGIYHEIKEVQLLADLLLEGAHIEGMIWQINEGQ